MYWLVDTKDIVSCDLEKWFSVCVCLEEKTGSGFNVWWVTIDYRERWAYGFDFCDLWLARGRQRPQLSLDLSNKVQGDSHVTFRAPFVLKQLISEVPVIFQSLKLLKTYWLFPFLKPNTARNHVILHSCSHYTFSKSLHTASSVQFFKGFPRLFGSSQLE